MVTAYIFLIMLNLTLIKFDLSAATTSNSECLICNIEDNITSNMGDTGLIVPICNCRAITTNAQPSYFVPQGHNRACDIVWCY